MDNAVPALGLLIDIVFGFLMWAALLRVVLTTFMKEDSRFLLMRLVNAITGPLLKVTRIVAPNWVIDRMQPLYAALLLFILRYYLVPLVLGYDVPGFGSMPLESLILSIKSDLGL